jgi:hypothetical protein
MVLQRVSGNTQNFTCVNFNAADVHWNVMTAYPGDVPSIDNMCKPTM